MLERQASRNGSLGLPTIDLVAVTQALVVAECLSFRRAARALGTQHPPSVAACGRSKTCWVYHYLSEAPLACGLQPPERVFSNKPVLGFDNSTTRSRPRALPVAVS